MKFRQLACFALAAALPLAPGRAAEETAQPKPGLMERLLHPFGAKKERSSNARGVNFKQLDLALTVEPAPLKLPETKQFKVMLQLRNKGNRMVQLDFPTTQRIEVLVKTGAGKLVEQSSEGRSFSNEPTLVTINPGERLEYAVNLATRDMAPGENYTVEAFFPNFEQLRKSRTVTPVK